MSLAQKEALAPGSFSAEGKAIFGSAVARILAGRHVRWLSSIGCKASAHPIGPDHVVLAPRPGQAEAPPAVGTGGSITFHNWAGYETLTLGGGYSADNYIANAAANFTVPSVSSLFENAVTAAWVGIGQGADGSSLIQAGAQSEVSNGEPGVYVWLEVYPLQSQQSLSLLVSPGDIIGVDVGYDPNVPGGEAGFIVCDLTTNTCVMPSPTESEVGASGDTAEWIVERPSYSTSNPEVVEWFPVTNFGQETFAYPEFVQATPSGTQRYFLSQSDIYSEIQMTSCQPASDPQLIALPGPNQGLSFAVNFENPGYQDYYNTVSNSCVSAP
jgi:hypothetical protein